MQMPDKPRTLKETIAAQEPAEQARLANAESFEDVTVSNPFHQQVTVIEDSDGTGDWRLNISTTTAPATSRCSPVLKRRSGLAITFQALKFGRLRAVRG
jgi:hypothetical protein